MVFNKTRGRKGKAAKKTALRRATNAVTGVGKKVGKTFRNIGKSVRNVVSGVFHKKSKSRRRSRKAMPVPPPVEETPQDHEPVKPLETPQTQAQAQAPVSPKPEPPKETPPVPAPAGNGVIPKVPSGTPAGGSF